MPRSLFAAIAVLCLTTTQAPAQSIDPATLKIVTDTIAQICGDFQREGGGTSTRVSGEAEARIKGLLGKLVDVGVAGAGEINSDEYTNVLREELGAEIRDNRRCNEKIWDDMKALILPAATSPGNSQSGTGQTTPQAPADISGYWLYSALCPNPNGFGQVEILGEVFTRAGGNNRFTGTIASNMGNFGEFTTILSGDTFESTVLWSDYSRSWVRGRANPVSGTWDFEDSFGCTGVMFRGNGQSG